MEISRNAWHMRVNQYFDDRFGPNANIRTYRARRREGGWPEEEIERYYPRGLYTPQNLCSHFWSTLGCLYVLPIFIAGTFAWRHILRYPAKAIAILALGAGAGFAWSWGHRPRRGRTKDMSREPSLIIEYLKARKRRVCPLITVKD